MNEEDKTTIKVQIYGLMIMNGMLLTVLGAEVISLSKGIVPYWVGLGFCIIGTVLIFYCVHQISKLDAKSETKEARSWKSTRS